MIRNFKLVGIKNEIRVIFFAGFLLTTWSSIAVEAQPLYKYEVIKVVDNVYLLKPILKRGRWVTANITVIVNDHDAVVVDSGLIPEAGKAAIEEIKKITEKPVTYLINTHWHGDHWQGNEAFVNAYPGIEIVATEEGYKGIMTLGMFDASPKGYAVGFMERIANNEHAVKTGKFINGEKVSDERLAQIKDILPEKKAELRGLQSIQPYPPTLTFKNQMFLKRGTREIQLYYLGYGNTTGDAVIYLPAERILIAGDLVVFPSPYESESFSREWLETYKKLVAFQFTYLIPGHGEIQHDTSYLNFLIALFEEIIRQVNREAVSSGNTLEGTKKAVTHESVTMELAKLVKFDEFLKKLNPGFVSDAVLTAYPKAKEGKL